MDSYNTTSTRGSHHGRFDPHSFLSSHRRRSHGTGALIMDTLRRRCCTGVDDVVVAAMLVVATTSLLLLFVYLQKQRSRRRRPPGPFAWPVVGNFPSLIGDFPHQILKRLADNYGGLMYLQLGSVPSIVISSAAVAKELFQSHDAIFLDRPKTFGLNIVMDGYKNVMAANGEYWRHLRKLYTSELFTATRLATYQTGRTEEIQLMVRELLADSNNGTTSVDMRSWLRGVTSNQMTRMFINKRYFKNSGDEKKEKEDFEALMVTSMRLVNRFIISDYVPYLRFITELQGWRKTFERLRDWTYDVAKGMLEIEKHKQRAKLSELQSTTTSKADVQESSYVPDFLDLLLRTPLADGTILPEKNLAQVILIDMMYAGTETSATTSEWALSELVRHPEAMLKLQNELNSVIGPTRVPQESDIANLPYLQAVVKEAFRLHPPIALNPHRHSTKAFEFRGYQFPEHTRLLINFYAIHRDSSVWDCPDEFRPDRFMEVRHSGVKSTSGFESYELVPFSIGRRMCPAANLGNMTVHMLVATLVHGFEWSLPKGVEDIDINEQFGLAVMKKTPLKLVAKPKPPAYLY